MTKGLAYRILDLHEVADYLEEYTDELKLGQSVEPLTYGQLIEWRDLIDSIVMDLRSEVENAIK